MDLKEFIKPDREEIKVGDIVKFPVELKIIGIDNVSFTANVIAPYWVINRNDPDLKIKKKINKRFQFLYRQKDGLIGLTIPMFEHVYETAFSKEGYPCIQKFEVEE